MPPLLSESLDRLPVDSESPLTKVLDWSDLIDNQISGKTFSVVTFGCQMNKHD